MTEATGPADDISKNDDVADAANNAAPEAGSKAGASASAKSTGTSLAPASDAPSGIDPFIAIAAADAPPTAVPRPFYAKALDYSAHAAMAIGLIGFAWTVSDHVVAKHPADAPAVAVKRADAATATPAPVVQKPVEAKVDPVDELRKTNQKMASEIRNLRASLEALRTTVAHERTATAAPSDESRAEIRALSASVDTLKSSLAGTKTEQSASLAQLSAKLEKLQREEKAPLPVAEHKPERQPLDPMSTASIPPAAAKAVPTPPAKPTTLASARPEDMAAAEKPQAISGWVVREVYQGVALIESRRGQMEVVPGVSIPGAGTVKTIERHNGTWTVTTTKGQFASAAPAPQREPQHRAYRDYYGPSAWDY